jgi:CubicO group peptidase (beta-lactamase class C family)
MNKITAIFVFVLFCFFTLVSFGQDQKGVNIEKLDAYMQKALTEWGIPGMAIAVVQGDSIAFAKGYGIKEYGKDGKVDSKTLFSIASNTKAFTASALSILIDQGKLNWDDKVIDHLEWFRMYDPYVTENMTVRDLLCHRSGLKTFSGDLLWYETSYSRKEVIERARYLEPVYGFRSHYGYSNIMFSAAGEIIPAVNGISWEEFVRKNFFKKLNMKNSLLSVTEMTEKMNVALPHHVSEEADPLPIKYMSWDNVAPAASIISNVEDMGNWLIMNMNEGVFRGDTILDELQIWEMQSVHTPDNNSKGWQSYFPTLHFNAYGLGWSLFDYQGVKVVSHGGGADGMISQTMFVPEEDFGMVILTNSINYLPPAMMYYVIDSYFGKKEKDWSGFYKQVYDYGQRISKEDYNEKLKNKAENTKPTFNLESYAGTYGGELYGNAEVRLEEGKLVLDFLPSETLIGDLTHWHYDVFEIKLRNSPTLPRGWVQFLTDADGNITELKVDIPNPDFHFTELEFMKK